VLLEEGTTGGGRGDNHAWRRLAVDSARKKRAMGATGGSRRMMGGG